MVIMLMMGFASGLPLTLTGTTLVVRINEWGVNIQTIGLFSLVGLPYILKFLWAPLFDVVYIPGFSKFLGRRRAIIFIVQILLGVSIFALGVVPTHQIRPTIIAAILVAFLSASQDIVLDAFRIESFKKEQQAAALAVFTTGYRIAMTLSTAGIVLIMAFFNTKNAHTHVYSAWNIGYGSMAISLLVVGLFSTLIAHEPQIAQVDETFFTRVPIKERLKRSIVEPLRNFTQRRDWILIFVFIIIYKIGDVLAGHMFVPFFAEKGISGQNYLLIESSIAVFMTVAGTFIGGALSRSLGTKTSLIIGASLQGISNASFAVFFYMLPHLITLGIFIGFQEIAWSIGSIVFIGWISELCHKHTFTGTEYALLSALATLARILFPAYSGYMVASMGYVFFFITTGALSFISLPLILRIYHKSNAYHV